MVDFNPLLEKIKNPFVLIFSGVFIYLTFDMWYVKLLGALITTAGLSILADKVWVIISNRYYRYSKQRDIKNYLKYLESGDFYDKLLSNFLKVLSSQDTRVFSRGGLIGFLGDDYKNKSDIIESVIGGSDYPFDSSSILHELVNKDIVNYDRDSEFLPKYSVSIDYWNALIQLYPEIHKSRKITFVSVYEDIFRNM